LLISLIVASNAHNMLFSALYKSHRKFIFRHTSVETVTVNIMAPYLSAVQSAYVAVKTFHFWLLWNMKIFNVILCHRTLCMYLVFMKMDGTVAQWLLWLFGFNELNHAVVIF